MSKLTTYEMNYVTTSMDGDKYLMTIPSLYAWNNLISAYEKGLVKLPKNFFSVGTLAAPCFLKQNTDTLGNILIGQVDGFVTPKLVASYELFDDAFLFSLNVKLHKKTQISKIQEINAAETTAYVRPCLVPLNEDGIDNTAFVDAPNGTVVYGGTFQIRSPISGMWHIIDIDNTEAPYRRTYDETAGVFRNSELKTKPWEWVVWDGMLVSTRCAFNTSAQALWESKLAFPIRQF